MKRILNFFIKNSSFVLCLVTIILTVITYFYLRETMLIRRVSQQSLYFETSPQVFLENVVFIRNPNDSTHEFIITTIIFIKNTGRTQATDFKTTYSFMIGTSRKDGVIEAPYLFPTQSVKYTTKSVRVQFSEKDYPLVKNALLEERSIIAPPNVVSPVLLDVEITYLDQNKNPKSFPYKIKYFFHNNVWSFISEQDEENSN